MEPFPFPEMHTARLHLRELVAADAPTMLAIHGDAQAIRWFGTDPLADLAQAEAMIEMFAGWRRQPNPGTRWGIADAASGTLVGSCGLFKWNRGWRCCTLGFELAPSAQGRGLMQEALSAVLPWGFEHMALNRVEAQVHPDNLPSLRLVERLGFVREGVLREAGFWLGAYHDLVQHSLLASELKRAG